MIDVGCDGGESGCGGDKGSGHDSAGSSIPSGDDHGRGVMMLVAVAVIMRVVAVVRKVWAAILRGAHK